MFTRALTYMFDQRCWKRSNRGQCCCNCKFHFAIHGHPWITNTSIMQPTGLYVCTSKERGDKSKYFIISNKHGACEGWAPL